FKIFPLSTPGPVLKGLKIPRLRTKDDRTKANLWVEYRQPNSIYEKSGVIGMWKTDGAVVHYTNPDQPSPLGWSWPNETILLNFLPPGWVEPPFQTDFVLRGEWKDIHSMVSIKVLNVVREFLELQIDIQ